MIPGDIQTVIRGEKHSFTSVHGAIFEEVSTTNVKNDSYYEDEKIIEGKIKAMNKRNLDLVMKQMEQKKQKLAKKNKMSDTEYAMNRETLQKAKETLNNQK